MQIAQKLYEGMDLGSETAGLITYMRTDGVQMAPEAFSAARRAIGKVFGEKYLPEKPRYYATKAKNAQEAHEAIRPTDFFAHPKDDAQVSRCRSGAALRADLEARHRQPDAVGGDRAHDGRNRGAERRRAPQTCAPSARSSGSTAFSVPIPIRRKKTPMTRKAAACRKSAPARRSPRKTINATQHSTEPPPRYSEATLIKKMEELGIGRPSTYAATLKTLRDREYVTIDKRKLIPEAKGRLVIAFLESFFKRYVEYDFTADLEEKLDEISDGKLDWKDVLRDFWTRFLRRGR